MIFYVYVNCFHTNKTNEKYSNLTKINKIIKYNIIIIETSKNRANHDAPITFIQKLLNIFR